MTGGEIVLGAALWIVVALVVVMFMGVRLVFRIIDRGARVAVRAADQLPSLFGPGGEPWEIAKRLRERTPSLSRGPGNGTGLAFSCAGLPGRLDFITDLTEIRFALGGRAKETLEVSTPGFITQLAEDDPEAFRVRGSAEFYARMFKDPALARMLRGWRVSFELSVRPHEFFLQLRGQPRTEEELWRWLKGSFALLQAALDLEAVGAVQVTRVSAGVLHESVCQVCGGTLGQGAVVYCSACSTPHHDDCWTYAGECSTFACRERKFVR